MIDQSLHDLYLKYRSLPVDMQAERKAIADQMAIICKKIARPIIAKINLNGGAFRADEWESDALLKMLDVANNENVEIKDFAAVYVVAVKNAIMSRFKKKRPINFTDNVDAAYSVQNLVYGNGHQIIPDELKPLANKVMKAFEGSYPETLDVYFDMLAGIEYKDIAQTYSIPMGTVKRRIHTVREKLRKVDGLEKEIQELSQEEKKHLAHLISATMEQETGRIV